MTTNTNRENIWLEAIEKYNERTGNAPQPKAFLFDMDGVLFDSMKNHTLAWYKTMTGLGIPCERNEFYLYEGCTGKGTINNFFRRTYSHDATDEEVQQIYSIKSDHFNKMPLAEPMPGAKEVLDSVQRKPSLGTEPFALRNGEHTWSVIEIIPVEALFRSSVDNFSGKEMRANFYKCGDELPTPHFLSWNPIEWPEPSFHRPEQFGKLIFE